MQTSDHPEALIRAEIHYLEELRDHLRQFESSELAQVLRRTQCHLDIAIASLDRDADSLAWSRPLAVATDDRLVASLVG